MTTQRAMFGAGCFWGVEDAFRQVPGVTAAAVGYAGGETDEPNYKQVCTGQTGHAEVVYVEFDPDQVDYDQLLDVFFAIHDPTQVDRQGPDVGTQYRSVIFYYDEDQETLAAAKMAELEFAGSFKRRIATQLEPAPTFWRAEDYHQQYAAKHGHSCAIKLPF